MYQLKFYLTQNASLDYPTQYQYSQDKELGIRRLRAKITAEGIAPCDGSPVEVTESCTKFREYLLRSYRGHFITDWFQFELAATNGTRGAPNVCIRIPSGSVMRTLVEHFGEDLWIKLSFSQLFVEGCQAVGDIRTSELTIRKCGGDYAVVAERVPTAFHGWGQAAVNGNALRGELTVIITVNQPFVASYAISGPVVTDKTQVYKKMLQEELGSDLVIIAGNGRQFRAHKGVLLAHSDVFNAMFRSDMKEAKTHILELPDMSEEGVRGLLAYLYCWEEVEPKDKPLVAFEMLHAGHKYMIPVLETAMKKVLLNTMEAKFSVDVALRLFLLARVIPSDGNYLKMKAVKVLKGNFGNFKNSPTYVALFKEYPEAAMELCEHFVA